MEILPQRKGGMEEEREEWKKGKEGGGPILGEEHRKRETSVGRAMLPYLGVVLKGAHLAAYHRAIFLATTESLFQAHLDIVTGVFVSTI